MTVSSFHLPQNFAAMLKVFQSKEGKVNAKKKEKN